MVDTPKDLVWPALLLLQPSPGLPPLSIFLPRQPRIATYVAFELSTHRHAQLPRRGRGGPPRPPHGAEPVAIAVDSGAGRAKIPPPSPRCTLGVSYVGWPTIIFNNGRCVIFISAPGTIRGGADGRLGIQ